MDDLWPDLTETQDVQITPVSILKEQASLLGKKTRNLVKADMIQKSRKFPDGRAYKVENFLVYDFVLIAPLLDNYMVRLFTSVHDIMNIYPIRLVLNEQLFKELYGGSETEPITIGSQDSLMSELIKIFGSETTKNIIRTFSSLTPEHEEILH